MQYLVQMEAANWVPLWPPEELGKFIEQVVDPGHNIMEQLKAEGKIVAGGLVVGRRNMTFIAEVATNDELDQLMSRIPWWRHTDTQVTALKSWGPRQRDK